MPLYLPHCCQVTGGTSYAGFVPSLCGTNDGQHVVYSAVPNLPARLSVVVDTSAFGAVVGNFSNTTLSGVGYTRYNTELGILKVVVNVVFT